MQRPIPFVDPCPECGAASWTLDERRDEWTCDICGLAVDAHQVHGTAVTDTAPAKGRLTGRLARVEKQSLRIRGNQQRMLDAQAEAKRIAEAVGCPLDVAERAGLILKSARKAGITQGRSLDAMAAASLLAACRMLYLTRPPQDLAAASPATEDDIQNAYKALVNGLRLPVPTMSAFEYLGQLASKAELPPETAGKAQTLLAPICGTVRAAGKNPMGWAAAGLWMAARDMGRPIAVSRLAKAAGISPSTLQARLDELA